MKIKVAKRIAMNHRRPGNSKVAIPNTIIDKIPPNPTLTALFSFSLKESHVKTTAAAKNTPSANKRIRKNITLPPPVFLPFLLPPHYTVLILPQTPEDLLTSAVFPHPMNDKLHYRLKWISKCESTDVLTKTFGNSPGL